MWLMMPHPLSITKKSHLGPTAVSNKDIQGFFKIYTSAGLWLTCIVIMIFDIVVDYIKWVWFLVWPHFKGAWLMSSL